MTGSETKPEAPPAASPRRGGGPPRRAVVPHAPKWHQRLAARLIYTAIRCLALTIRFRVDQDSRFLSELPPEKIIFAIWHNRLVLSLIIYHRYVTRRDRTRKLASIASASRDGGLVTSIIELFGVAPVRGSSSRRAAPALRELVAWAERGYDLAITPDGPRGPRYTLPEGVIATAQLSGLTIVPVAYHLNWKICLKPWDRFQIPLPFACCKITTGRMLRVPRSMTGAEREILRQQVEADLRAITRD
jgi:lysophospholipid acyltransferase (LPLAT)-like uncharacterized protein